MNKEEEKKMILKKDNPPLSIDERKTRFLHLLYEIVGNDTTPEVRDKVNRLLGIYEKEIESIISCKKVLFHTKEHLELFYKTSSLYSEVVQLLTTLNPKD